MRKTRKLGLTHIQKEIILRTHPVVSSGKPNTPLCTLSFEEKEDSLESLGKYMIYEYVAKDIRNLFGISLIEFANLNIVDYRLCVETALKIAKDREAIKENIEKEAGGEQ